MQTRRPTRQRGAEFLSANLWTSHSLSCTMTDHFAVKRGGIAFQNNGDAHVYCSPPPRRFRLPRHARAGRTSCRDGPGCLAADQAHQAHRAVPAGRFLGHHCPRHQPAAVGGAQAAGDRGEPAGANGNLGADLVAKSAPDGYTLLLCDVGALAISPSVYTKLPFDPSKDLRGVTMLAYSPHLLVVHPSVPAEQPQGTHRACRKTGDLNFAVTATGSAPHLAGVALERASERQVDLRALQGWRRRPSRTRSPARPRC